MGYLIGSLPMGVIVARLTGGTDPRTVGSGRTGGTNTLRAGGWGRAIAVGMLNLSKGAVPILIAGALDAPIESARSPAWPRCWAAGSRSSSASMAAAASPPGSAAGPRSRPASRPSRCPSSSASSGSHATSCPASSWPPSSAPSSWWPAWRRAVPTRPARWSATPGEAIIWIAHRDNIARLLNGTERKFEPGDRSPTPLPSEASAGGRREP